MNAPFALLLATSLLAEPDAAERAAAAAEKAAAAAQTAAEAAQKAAEAAATVAGGARAAPAAAPAAAAPAPAPAPKWSGTVGVGLISLTGNSKSVTFNANGAAERKSDGWVLGLKALAVYGQTRPPEGGSTQTVAQAAGVQGRLDRKFHQRYSGYALAAFDTDHVKSVEIRYTGEAGASITWVDASGDTGWKTSLRTDLGFRWAQENRFAYYPVPPAVEGPLDTVTLYAPRLGLAFKYALNKNVVFSEDAEILPNVVGAGRVVVNSLAKLSSRLTESLSFGASFQVNHDSAPAAGKVATDTILGLTIEVLL
jgi:putative salt-induced outer membrane protein YdiY